MLCLFSASFFIFFTVHSCAVHNNIIIIHIARVCSWIAVLDATLIVRHQLHCLMLDGIAVQGLMDSMCSQNNRKIAAKNIVPIHLRLAFNSPELHFVCQDGKMSNSTTSAV